MTFSAKVDHGRGGGVGGLCGGGGGGVGGFKGGLTDSTQLRPARPRSKSLMSIFQIGYINEEAPRLQLSQFGSCLLGFKHLVQIFAVVFILFLIYVRELRVLLQFESGKYPS
jgi:hypothetical protein